MPFRTVVARAFSLLVCFLILFFTYQPIVRAQAPLPDLPGDPDGPGLFQRDRLISEWSSESGGFQIADLDGDGANEILAVGTNNWKIFSYDPSKAWYTVEYLSKYYFYDDRFPRGIDWVTLADFGSGSGYRIFVASDRNQLEVYDGATRRLVSTAVLPFTSSNNFCGSMVVRDIDLDSDLEIVMFVVSGLRVFNALTYTLEWSLDYYADNSHGYHQLAVGNTDADPNLEIVVEDRIFDGVTHAVEWQHNFGGAVQTADIDGDGVDEVISSPGPYYLAVYDADTKTTKWTIYSPYIDYATLTVADIDTDGTKEIVTGGDDGNVRTYDSITHVMEWSIDSPDRGTTSITTGDTDGDGQVEVLWGNKANYPSDDDDNLLIADAGSQTIEWRSGRTSFASYSGWYSSVVTGDVDADGQEEIVVLGVYQDDEIYGCPITVFDGKTFQLEWTGPGPYSGYCGNIKSIHLAMLDADPALEIIFFVDNFPGNVDLIAIDGKTHAQDWIWKRDNSTISHYGTIASGDVDLDGQIEVVAGEDQYLSVIDPSANEHEWKSGELDTIPPSGSSFFTGITLCDLDADPYPEIVARSEGLWVFDGRTKAVQWTVDFEGAIQVACADMEGVGQVEVVVADYDGEVHILDGQTGTLKASHTLVPKDAFGYAMLTGLILADLNHDAQMDIITSDGSVVIAFNGVDYQRLWQSQPLGDSNRTTIGDILLKDLDADGRPELLVGSSRSVTVFRFDPSDSNVPSFTSAFSAAQSVVKPGTVVAFQASLENPSSATRTFQATIPLPGGNLDGIPGATVGNVDVDAQNQRLVWTVTLSPSEAAQLSFALRLSSELIGGKYAMLSAYFHGDGIMLAQERSASVYVDEAPPHSVISSPMPASLLPAGDVLVSGTAGDDYGVASVELQFDDGAWETATGTNTWTATLAHPAEGPHQVRIRATDLVGNMETPGGEQSMTFSVDATPPLSAITSPAPESLSPKGTFTVAGTASDANGVAKVEVRVDNGSWEVATGTSDWSATLALSGDGPHQIRSRATDVAGNEEIFDSRQPIVVFLDTTPPQSAITSPVPTSVFPGGQVMVRGTASDAFGVAMVEVQFDSSQWVTASGTSDWVATFTPPVDGVHHLRVRSTDLVGNVETQEQTVSFVVDSIAPQSAISSPDPFGILFTGSGDVMGNASDNHELAKVEVQIDHGDWVSATGTSNWVATLPISADGLHLVHSRATDLAGNVETPGEGRPVYISNRAPVIHSVKPVSGSIDVDVNAPIEVQFNIPVLPASIALTCDPPVTLRVPWQGASALTLALDHTAFRDGTVITCKVESVQSTTAHALSVPYIWSFTTFASHTHEFYLPMIIR